MMSALLADHPMLQLFYESSKDDLQPCICGVFVSFFYLIARGPGVPWVGGALGERTGQPITFWSAVRFVMGVIIAFPVYTLVAFAFSEWAYGAHEGRQFFWS